MKALGDKIHWKSMNLQSYIGINAISDGNYFYSISPIFI